MLNPVWDPTVPGLAIFVGTNPVVSHGYGTALPDPIRYLREYRAAGGKVWVLDPRRTETAARADVHVPVRPGADVAVLAALANALLEHGADERRAPRPLRPDRGRRAARTRSRASRSNGRQRVADVDPALARTARRRRARAPGPHRDALRHRRDDGARRRARGVAALGHPHRVGLTRSRVGHVLPPRRRQPAPRGARAAPAATESPAAPSRPELPRVLGQIPAVALVDEIEAGNIRALFVTGGNPLTAFPQPARLRAALQHTRRARGRRRRRERAHRDRDARAARDRPARTGRHHAGRAHRAALRPAGDAAGRRAGRRTPTGLVDVRGVEPGDGSGDAGRRRTRTTSATRTTCAACSRTRALDADDVFAAGPRGIDTPVEYGWVHAELLARRPLVDRAGAAARTPRRVRRSRARRVRARAAAGDGVEQLGRVRRERERARSCA